MKVLLIQPPTNFIEQAYGVKAKVHFGNVPPLGIGYVAAYIRNSGCDVRLIDATAMGFGINETVDQVENYKPDLVGLSVLTNYKEDAKELSQAIKQRVPDATIVLGGPHATYFYREILDDMPAIDHVIYGEADLIAAEYAHNFRDKDKLMQIRGLVFRDMDGKTVVTEPADIVDNLDAIPMPAWDLYDIPRYRPLPRQYKKLPFFSMITSRGCWWRRCKFCFQAGSCATQYRRHSPERVIEEVETLYHKFGIREIAFWDDTFIMNLKWLSAFAGLLKEKKLDISWTASGRVNTMNEEMLRVIHEAGCWSMFIGVESGNQDLLDMIEKGITLEQARKVFALANKIGIETRGAFMLGLPGETPEKGRKTISFALELNPTYAIFYATHPRYGTELYNIAQRTGTLLDTNFRGMSKVTYIPEGYKNQHELEHLVAYAYRKFYLRPGNILKRAARIRTLNDVVELAKGFLLFLGLGSNR